TVRGNSLPVQEAKELDLHRFVGDGVTVSEDGLRVVATISGSLVRTDGKLSVKPLLRINRSVDLTTGNIDFPGNVVIDADVADGFTVTAAGDLLVNGVAAACKLESGGTLVLMNGMMGKGTGEIIAHGPLEAGFLRDCTVTCDQT